MTLVCQSSMNGEPAARGGLDVTMSQRAGPSGDPEGAENGPLASVKAGLS